jgi:hypothetical protein
LTAERENSIDSGIVLCLVGCYVVFSTPLYLPNEIPSVLFGYYTNPQSNNEISFISKIKNAANMTVLYLIIMLNHYKQFVVGIPLKDEGEVNHRKMGNHSHIQP